MTLKELLETRIAKDGQRPFLYFRDQPILFERFDRNVNRAANLFQGLGVGKGDPVCLFLPNCPEFLYLWFGLAKIGGVMVPLNVWLSGDGLKSIIDDSQARWIIVDESLSDTFRTVQRHLQEGTQKVWHGPNEKPPEGFTALSDLMHAAAEGPPSAEEVRDEDPVATVYMTGGTAGPPKGVVMSHAHSVNTGRLWAEDILGAGEGDLFFTTTPLCELNTQFASILGSLVAGCPNVLQEDFLAPRFFPEVRRWGATIFTCDERMLATLIRQPETPEDANHLVRIAAGMGASSELCEGFRSRFNVVVPEGYGLAETGGLCLCNPLENRKTGSIGKPLRTHEVTIWNEENKEVPAGVTGEIVVRGKTPNTMFLGYSRQPDKTREAWEGGWFHTGDIGYMDADGYVYREQGRRK
jgi:crotonobetaine/carnitine-CoA ligase